MHQKNHFHYGNIFLIFLMIFIVFILFYDKTRGKSTPNTTITYKYFTFFYIPVMRVRLLLHYCNEIACLILMKLTSQFKYLKMGFIFKKWILWLLLGWDMSWDVPCSYKVSWGVCACYRCFENQPQNRCTPPTGRKTRCLFSLPLS